MDHVIDQNGIYSGHITVIPPRGHGLVMKYTGGIVVLIRRNFNKDITEGKVIISGIDSDSVLNDTFKRIPDYLI